MMLGEKYGEYTNGGSSPTTDNPDMTQLEERGEVVFKNGAVYKGFWLGD